MTDHEIHMLMRAGAAAGLDVGVIHQRPHRRCDAGWTHWNPLTDDGDALRLVVALGIHLQFAMGFSVAYAGSVYAKQFTERDWSDPGAATRRAIVRAAAELGATNRA